MKRDIFQLFKTFRTFSDKFHLFIYRKSYEKSAFFSPVSLVVACTFSASYKEDVGNTPRVWRSLQYTAASACLLAVEGQRGWRT